MYLKPKEIRKAPHHLHINWSDGRFDVVNFADLRRECSCAVCREFVRKPDYSEPRFEKLRQILSMDLVGNYALGIIWGDSHRSIYSFDRLRSFRNDSSREAG